MSPPGPSRPFAAIPHMSGVGWIVLQKSPSGRCEIEICNNRIGTPTLLNRCCALTPDLESMFRGEMIKIVLQHNPPDTGRIAALPRTVETGQIRTLSTLGGAFRRRCHPVCWRLWP